MKVIFLDIDGVLNDAYTDAKSPNGFIGLDDNKIDCLKEIVDRTGAVIVLCSTWKTDWDENPYKQSGEGSYLVEKLKKHGLEIYSKTPSYVTSRGEAITLWLLDRNDIDGFVIIDDIIFADYIEFDLVNHVVQTSFVNGGLLPEHVGECVNVLNGVFRF